MLCLEIEFNTAKFDRNLQQNDESKEYLNIGSIFTS